MLQVVLLKPCLIFTFKSVRLLKTMLTLIATATPLQACQIITFKIGNEFGHVYTERRAKLIIVDMPGYGFAYAQEALREDWKGLVKI